MNSKGTTAADNDDFDEQFEKLAEQQKREKEASLEEMAAIQAEKKGNFVTFVCFQRLFVGK